MLSIPENYRVCTAEENRGMDTFTIQEFGIPSFTLMEIAGAKTADAIFPYLKPQSRGLVLCGKGNNAGDALVAARHLHRRNIRFDVVFISGTESMSDDASRNLHLVQKLMEADTRTGEPALVILEGWNPDNLRPGQYSFIIDGMLGTGLADNVRGDYAKAISWTNALGLPVFSIDVPTGLHADTGEVLGNSITASVTCTYGALKTGFYMNEGPNRCGKIVFCDLGFPSNAPATSHRYVIEDEWVRVCRESQPVHHPRHKYEAGVVYLIAGSEGLTGAVQMAAISAWRTGVGAVTIIIPHGLLPVFETTLIHQVKIPVGRRDDFHFTPAHTEDVLGQIRHRPGCVLLGPGLGRHKETVAFVQELTGRIEADLVIDADGLWCLAQGSFPVVKSGSSWILTPHPGELSQLAGRSVSEPFERMTIAESMAQEHGVVIVAKGMPTYISQSGRHTLMTTYDTTVFSRTGYGDVLAGKIAGNLARSQESVLSCAAALQEGRHKYDHALQTAPHPPEPMDLV